MCAWSTDKWNIDHTDKSFIKPKFIFCVTVSWPSFSIISDCPTLKSSPKKEMSGISICFSSDEYTWPATVFLIFYLLANKDNKLLFLKHNLVNTVSNDKLKTTLVIKNISWYPSIKLNILRHHDFILTVCVARWIQKPQERTSLIMFSHQHRVGRFADT